MRRLFFVFVLLTTLSFNNLNAQTTSNCLEVESILVDACSPDMKEGQNEMVRILAGPANLYLDSLIPVWPNHTFGGWIMNAVTAQKTQELNNSIVSCGYILEPLSGFIPANRKAILVTSWDMNTTANSFAGLSDTIYIVYQNTQQGNAGHFANAGTGFRTLTIGYPPSCLETVTYNRNSLTGGDGAFVAFTQSGIASYGNEGCTAPVESFSIDAGSNPPPVCPGGTVSLSAQINGSATFQQWSGGTGSFTNSGNTTTNYTLGAGDNAPFWLYFKAKGACADTLSDSVLVSLVLQNPLLINTGGFTSICPGSTLTLTASGGGSAYQWQGGPATAQYVINAPGTYTVQSSDACYNYQQSVTISAGTASSVNIVESNFDLCAGSTATLSATGSGTITWSTGATGASITINGPGTYTASVTGNCGTVTDNVTVSALAAPTVLISPAQAQLCPGSTLQLSAASNGSVVWSDGSSGVSTTINQPGVYWAASSNSCGTATDSINVSTGIAPQAQILNPLPLVFCAGETIVLNGQANGSQIWSTGSNANDITVTQSGTYYLVSQTACGTDTAFVNVTISDISAQFTANPLQGNPGLEVSTLNQSTGADLYVWTSGSGQQSATENTTFTYNETGTFNLTLVVSNANGCSDTATVEVLVFEELEVKLPNIFTPNGDLINDIFEITAQGVSAYKLKIFNRWGNPVFTAESVLESWDGKTAFGSEAPAGVYFCVLEVEDALGKPHSFTGTVTLTR